MSWAALTPLIYSCRTSQQSPDYQGRPGSDCHVCWEWHLWAKNSFHTRYDVICIYHAQCQWCTTVHVDSGQSPAAVSANEFVSLNCRQQTKPTVQKWHYQRWLWPDLDFKVSNSLLHFGHSLGVFSIPDAWHHCLLLALNSTHTHTSVIHAGKRSRWKTTMEKSIANSWEGMLHSVSPGLKNEDVFLCVSEASLPVKDTR